MRTGDNFILTSHLGNAFLYLQQYWMKNNVQLAVQFLNALKFKRSLLIGIKFSAQVRSKLLVYRIEFNKTRLSSAHRIVMQTVQKSISREGGVYQMMGVGGIGCGGGVKGVK